MAELRIKGLYIQEKWKNNTFPKTLQSLWRTAYQKQMHFPFDLAIPSLDIFTTVRLAHIQNDISTGLFFRLL